MNEGNGGGRVVLAALALLCAVPGHAQPPSLQARVEARLAEAGPGTRFGLVVTTADGRELVAIAPEGRFVPASATKMFTIAAAFASIPGLDRPDMAGGASVVLEQRAGAAPDLVLEGHGDSRLSSAADCAQDCLATLADAAAAAARTVGNVIGDDSFYPDERWSPGMSWNNIPTASGTATSALTLDDNELPLLVTAAAAAGQRPRTEMGAYYILRNEAVTVPAGGATALDVERLPLSRTLRLTGTIAADAKPQRIRLGIDDPADHAAWRLRGLLEARGVRVTGTVQARHQLTGIATARAQRQVLARLTPPPLLLDLKATAKVSQNLHAELVLRRLGGIRGTGSVADGVAAVRAMLDSAGVPRRQAEFSDGSGMSTYNRLSPRGAVTFLNWAARQPWGEAWRATLPIGGLDGTLARRFRGGPLEGRVTAKTGSLNQASALVGYLVAKSGRPLAFAVFANDIPEGAPAVKAMDAALELIASQN